MKFGIENGILMISLARFILPFSWGMHVYEQLFANVVL